LALYRVQQAYVARLEQQQASLRNYERYNYDSDPYFYTPSIYRYNRGGRYYETNQYGADLLREGRELRYDEGFRFGQADRQDGWPYNFRAAYAYKDANVGYRGYYVGQADYNYYFREGFRRGYDDGYYSRSRYGRSSANGRYSILGSALSKILTLVSLR
jgi:hypothetical protein